MHAGRNVYYVEGKSEGEVKLKNIINGPADLSFARGNGCPMTKAAVQGNGCPMAKAEPPAAEEEPRYPRIRFGRMFLPRWGEGKSDAELEQPEEIAELEKLAGSLMALGQCMDDPVTCHHVPPGARQEESNIPAGYTYLGQFITHEITFDTTDGLPLRELKPENARSPSLDLDSLYGVGLDEENKRLTDDKVKRLYEEENQQGKNPARLKLGPTQPPPNAFPGKPSSFDVTFDNDLPRVKEGNKKGEAIIGDERNDENLPLAQTHVAFIKFHNRVVNDLAGGLYRDINPPPADKLFGTAREQVVKHFQWLILKDYLPKLVGDDMVQSVLKSPRLYPLLKEEELFIPLEFSAAAFRIGHSMVRQSYRWNLRHEEVPLFQLFIQTKRSGSLGGFNNLDSTWPIDWKRFYDFSPYAAGAPPLYKSSQPPNMAGRFDTVFDLHLGKIEGFNHNDLPVEKRAITVRNLLRGLALGLPWGEDVADSMEKLGLLERDEDEAEKRGRLMPGELRDGEHAALLDAAEFKGKTPLWFYILKEARVRGQGNKLGPVGGRIVAETLIGLIRHSRYTILGQKQNDAGETEWELSDWRPAYGRPAAKPEAFEMIDLLHAADAVDPVGKRGAEAISLIQQLVAALNRH
jgi:hypothetical protein